ncbi:hypothetical protein G6F24_016806 [Rhizopus arrhizus]|nr:hypothetical protein G6F24_016806 [Rhizopus arrhizus]
MPRWVNPPAPAIFFTVTGVAPAVSPVTTNLSVGELSPPSWVRIARLPPCAAKSPATGRMPKPVRGPGAMVPRLTVAPPRPVPVSRAPAKTFTGPPRPPSPCNVRA